MEKTETKNNKFIIIQIDALPYSTLKRFLDNGSCKFISSLIKKEGYNLHRFNCGIPTGTSSVQAGIIYGDSLTVPGYRFIDKKETKQISFANPYHAKYIESTYFSSKKGILEKGSSYANHFSGGASRSILTMSTIAQKKYIKKRLKEGSLWLSLFLNPAYLLRVIYFTLAEIVLELAGIIAHPFVRFFTKRKAIFGFRVPLRKFLMYVILAEIITIGVIRDIKKGVPKIYVTYMGFDDIGHLRRPNSVAAYFMVRALDRRVKRIYKRTKGKYDFFVLSDHGQVDAVPFRAVNGMTINDFVQHCAKDKDFEIPGAPKGLPSKIAAVIKKPFELFAKSTMKTWREDIRRFVWDEKEKIFVLDSCSLAHVYFNTSRKRMNLRQINRKYPALVKKLADNRHIGVVMAKQGEDIVLLSRGGRMLIKENSVKKIGKDSLKRFGNEELLVKQLRDFNRMRFLGDLVLFGNYENGVAVSFADHVGAHGGIGGDMSWPFFVSKKKYDFSGVTNAVELHKIFKEYQ